MTIKEIRKISKMVPEFVMMCENEFGEDEHNVKNPLSYEEYEDIQKLVQKLNNCINYTDGYSFK